MWASPFAHADWFEKTQILQYNVREGGEARSLTSYPPRPKTAGVWIYLLWKQSVGSLVPVGLNKTGTIQILATIRNTSIV
jgi:hypothetical protein